MFALPRPLYNLSLEQIVTLPKQVSKWPTLVIGVVVTSLSYSSPQAFKKGQGNDSFRCKWEKKKKNHTGRTNTKLWFHEGGHKVWDPWFRCYVCFVCWGLKWLDWAVWLMYFPVLKDLSDMQEDDQNSHWLVFDFILLLNYCSPHFLEGNLFAFFMQTSLCCGVVISPLFFKFDGNLWWYDISVASHMSSQGGSCTRFNCQYRLMHNEWQCHLCTPA